MKKTKEQAYDTRVAPFVELLIKVCREEGIAMIAHFEIGTDALPGLCASAHQPDADGMCSQQMAAALVILLPDRHLVAPSPPAKGLH